MFGYVVPDEGELKVKELALYRAYYCGLCKAIGSGYGQKARLFLNYDCAFLALMVAGLSEPLKCEEAGCIKHAVRKHPVAGPQPALDYAAAVNVLLAAFRARDERKDEKTFRSIASIAALHSAEKKAARKYPRLADSIRKQLLRLADAESANETCTDVPADAFGTLMRAVITEAPGVNEKNKPQLSWMFYNLGRWIYLIDAWDDLEKDRKSGNYNPFLAAGSTKNDASFLIGVSLEESEKGFDLIPLLSNEGPINNIMHEGLRRKTRLVLEGTKNESL